MNALQTRAEKLTIVQMLVKIYFSVFDLYNASVRCLSLVVKQTLRVGQSVLSEQLFVMLTKFRLCVCLHFEKARFRTKVTNQ